jgi:hypothetical protein
MATLSGLLGNSFIGLQGIQGTQGLQGNQGIQSAQGLQGNQGLQSTQGIQGLIGGVLTGVPQNSQSAQYELVALDSGKHVSTTANVIIPASVFSVGDTITIFNNSDSNITISTKSGQVITLYLAGTSSVGTRTLARRGLCTILCVVGGFQPSFVIAGSGLT